jgi:hypothetical protein
MIYFAKFVFLTFPKKYHAPFLWISPKKNPFRLDKQLVLCLQRIIVFHIMHNRILYMILILPRHSYIYDPDSSPSQILQNKSFWSIDFGDHNTGIHHNTVIKFYTFFPVTVLYMILILLRRYLIYDPDSSLSLSYIWSWFFPVTVLYMILILPRHCLMYDPDSSPSLSYIWDSDGEEAGSYIRQWRGRIRIIYKTVTEKNQDHI